MEEQYIVTNADGDKFYYKDKSKTILHRIDGPAFEHTDGNEAWYVNGKRHRLDGPAIEYVEGSKSWYVNGVFIMMVDKEGRLIDRMR
jgi:hypothetical protein